jgi:hypothetical protein
MLTNNRGPGEKIPRIRVIAYHAIAEFLGKICGELLEAYPVICSP